MKMNDNDKLHLKSHAVKINESRAVKINLYMFNGQSRTLDNKDLLFMRNYEPI